MAFLNLLLLLPLAWAELSVTEPAARIANAVDFHAKQHADHEKHEEKDENSKATEQKAPATQHWWGRFWPFVLPGTPMRSDIADSVQLDEQNHHEHGKEEKGNDHKSAVDHGAETNKGHWWDHLWPFAMSTQAEISPNSQLLADGQDRKAEDEDHKDHGHKDHEPESHWWQHLWPFALLTAAFPAIGVYVFKRAQSAMQQPLLEAQAEV
mmetsp:Transcript_124917/g.176256  ORF Transcript_124917/g.176256 Transcript_124917/m.176256 type:complete len:209 (-) Transcript_124917:145-771(-)|eukprot:symbB.v1.2.009018.t1/scaffold564.1/size186654/12